jgi:hypothetical protein
MRICFPGLFAGLKDDGRVPKADGKIAMRATPEPPRLPASGSADRSPMPKEGQRTHNSRWSHAHPGSPGKPDTGQRGLDIPGIGKPNGQQYAVVNERQKYNAKMLSSSRSWSAGCGESYLSGAGSAGRNSTAERQHGRRPSTLCAENVLCEQRRNLPGSLHRVGGEVANAKGGAADP